MAAPLGPFETEAEARTAALEAAEPGLQAIKPADNRRLLGRVCAAAGVAMGGYDSQTAEWLSVWAPSTVAAVAGWVGRAYDAGLNAVPPGAAMLPPADATVKVRLSGTGRGCGEAARRLHRLFYVTSMSQAYPEAGSSRLVRVYVRARLDRRPEPPPAAVAGGLR